MPLRVNAMTNWTLSFVVTVTPTAAVTAAEPQSRALNLPAAPFPYSQVKLPEHVAEVATQYDNTTAENPLTDHGATLGRVLFYDSTLSANGTTSCASCHQQSRAFTDDRRVSLGFKGQPVDRNSMSLVNLRYYRNDRFFWDERAESLEQQVLMPIENEIEMGHDLTQLVPQLAAEPWYPPLFQAAFGDPAISRQRIAAALAQFVRSIVSFDSRYDQGLAVAPSVEAPFANFSDLENRGKDLFFGAARCASCHVASPAGISKQFAFFYVEKAVVNGIDSDTHTPPDLPLDPGVAGVTGDRGDLGRFKSPSLRNVEVTGPYMHDGRFTTLEAVVEHYNWSIRPHVNLDQRLHLEDTSGLAMRQDDVDAVVAFMRTLTDDSLLSAPQYSDPFVHDESEIAADPVVTSATGE